MAGVPSVTPSWHARSGRFLTLTLDGIVIKRLAPLRVAELTGEAAGYRPEAITPVIQPLYCDLWQHMANAGVAATGPALAYYEDAPPCRGAVLVHAAVPVASAAPVGQGFSVVDLAEVERAAVVIHHGPMDDVLSTDQALARWIDANGYGSGAAGLRFTSPTPARSRI